MQNFDNLIKLVESQKDISVYIHIPFCKSKCIYCDFFSRAEFYNNDFFDEYVNALCKEIQFYTSFKKIKLNTVYIGGGTPSLLSTFQLKKICDCLAENFLIDFDNFEFTLEMNPDDVSKALIEFINDSIITRISLGIQSLKNETLLKMNRRATRQKIFESLSLIKSHFTKRLSLDLIAGFPGESAQDLIENLTEILDFNPEHISLYSLCVEEGTPLFDKIESNKIDFDFDKSDEIWLCGKEFLENHGFFQYEISNFCRAENSIKLENVSLNENLLKTQSFHNLVYWHLKNYFGFGSGATGSFFAKENSFRYSNSNDIKKYVDFWNNLKFDFSKNEIYKNEFPLEIETLDEKTQEFEFFMMGFRLAKGISKKDYESRFCKNQNCQDLENQSENQSDKIPPSKNQLNKNSQIKEKTLLERLNQNDNLFDKWCDKGFAEIEKTSCDEFFRLTKIGRLYLNSFLEELI